MKSTVSLFFISCLIFASNGYAQTSPAEINKKEIEVLLDQWHEAAAHSDFEGYFSFMADDAIYIGTDATENWGMAAFKKFAKPFFKKGQGWAFTDLDRNINFSKDGNTAWFDELLKTHMGLCRGSGVLAKDQGEWKIKHYVLSMTVPNAKVSKVEKLKKDFDETYEEKLLETKK